MFYILVTVRVAEFSRTDSGSTCTAGGEALALRCEDHSVEFEGASSTGDGEIGVSIVVEKIPG